MLIEGYNHCVTHYFGVKTLSETPCSPPLKQPGYGARFRGSSPEELCPRPDSRGALDAADRGVVQGRPLGIQIDVSTFGEIGYLRTLGMTFLFWTFSNPAPGK